jgi:hypothetical protein
MCPPAPIVAKSMPTVRSGVGDSLYPAPRATPECRLGRCFSRYEHIWGLAGGLQLAPQHHVGNRRPAMRRCVCALPTKS